MNDKNVNKDLKVRHLIMRKRRSFHTQRRFTESLVSAWILGIMFHIYVSVTASSSSHNLTFDRSISCMMASIDASHPRPGVVTMSAMSPNPGGGHYPLCHLQQAADTRTAQRTLPSLEPRQVNTHS